MRNNGRSTEKSSGFIVMVLLLYSFWLSVSEHVDVQHLVTGLLVTLPIAYFWRDLVPEKLTGGKRLLSKTWYFLRYLVCLAWEIIRANTAVARIILDPKLPISPTFITFETRLKSNLGRTLFGNSITLTPGTLTVNITAGGRVTVQALTAEAAQGVKGWYLEEILAALEGGKENV